jgi:hypothetical protein
VTHAIKRTNPTGPGQKFVGQCIKCGKTGLSLSDAQKRCPEDGAVSDQEALLTLIENDPESQL